MATSSWESAPSSDRTRRRALVLGQLLEVAQHVAQVLAALDLRREPLGCGLGVLDADLLLAGAQDRQTPVAGDGVEPRLELDGLVGGGEIAVGGGEGVLDRVLALLAGADHVAAEGEDPAVVTIVDGLEGRLVTATDQADELVVAREPQAAAWAPDEIGGSGGCSGGHVLRSNTPTQRARGAWVGR
jgi:hypothetical protein